MTASDSPLFGPLDPASELYTNIFTGLTARRQDAVAFRRLAELGLPAALTHAQAENRESAERILNDPENEGLFLSKQGFSDYVGGSEGLGDSITGAQGAAFRASVDAASLVFIHSAVDATLSDLCRLSSMLAPRDWMPWLKDKKVSLALATETAPAELLSQELAAELLRLERQSMLVRSERLFAVCRPSAEFDPIAGYTFDRERLESLDRLRHDLVHGPAGPRATIPNCEASIDYLFRTGLFHWVMLNHKYDVKMDPLADLKRSKAFEYAFHAMR